MLPSRGEGDLDGEHEPEKLDKNCSEQNATEISVLTREIRALKKRLKAF
jgi:hypothetical protein